MSKTVYDIVTKTGLNALDKPVEIEIKGPKGTLTFTLDKKGRDDFRAGAADAFEMTGEMDIGLVTHATIISGPHGGDHWSLDWIWVHNHGMKEHTNKGSFLVNNEGGYYPQTEKVKSCPHYLGLMRNNVG